MNGGHRDRPFNRFCVCEACGQVVDKRSIVLPVLRLQQLGYRILATEGTAEVLNRNGIAAEIVRKYSAEA